LIFRGRAFSALGRTNVITPSFSSRLVRLDGADLPDALAACLQLIPLDTFVPDPAIRMEMIDNPNKLPEVQVQCLEVIDKAEGRHVALVGVKRHALVCVRSRLGSVRCPQPIPAIDSAHRNDRMKPAILIFVVIIPWTSWRP
jgi:hypothetical protein